MRKTTFSSIFFIVLIMLFSSAQGAVYCPSTVRFQMQVARYIKDIQPVPFPQCYYLATSVRASKKNECKHIRKAIVRSLHHLHHHHKIKIYDWYCHFNPNEQENNYSFTFSADYKN